MPVRIVSTINCNPLQSIHSNWTLDRRIFHRIDSYGWRRDTLNIQQTANFIIAGNSIATLPFNARKCVQHTITTVTYVKCVILIPNHIYQIELSNFGVNITRYRN